MSENIKQITLTGVAAAEIGGSHLGKKERVKRRTGGEQNVANAQNASNALNASNAQNASNASNASNALNVPNPAINTPVKPVQSISKTTPVRTENRPTEPSPPASNTPMEGGTKTIKVELKKRSTAKRVHLQPKKMEPIKSKPQPQTKKARKVTLAVSALHKRMSRAKKMTRKAKEMSLPQLREHLIQKKLIKPTSKAPEAILRQIAADASIVAGKAL